MEATLAGSVAPALKESRALRFTGTEVGMAGAAYLAGALFFGWLTDQLGRKRLFTLTLPVGLALILSRALFVFGATLMLIAALIAARYAVKAERKPLEAVAQPLNPVDETF